MALDWSNERYVRLYARLTPDMAAWTWQAKAVWPWVLVAADGAGIIATAKGVRGVAAVLAGGGFPAEVVEAGLAELIADGCLEALKDGRGYVVRNYVEAQTATMSGNARKARQRDRERANRALAADEPVTPGHAASRDVTPGHAESQAGTETSIDVTPSRAEPSRDIPSVACASARSVGPAWDPDRGLGALAEHAIDRLNAARAKVDPSARPIPVLVDEHGKSLMDHLRPIPVDDRRAVLDHAIDVMVSTLAADGAPVDEYRMGMLAGPRSWSRWRDGSVAGAKNGTSRQASQVARSGPISPPRTQTPGPPKNLL